MKANDLLLVVHWKNLQVTDWPVMSKCYWSGMNGNMNRVIVKMPTSRYPLLSSPRSLRSPCHPSPYIFLVITVPIHRQSPNHPVVITSHLYPSTLILSWTSHPPSTSPLHQIFRSLAHLSHHTHKVDKQNSKRKLKFHEKIVSVSFKLIWEICNLTITKENSTVLIWNMWKEKCKI